MKLYHATPARNAKPIIQERQGIKSNSIDGLIYCCDRPDHAATWIYMTRVMADPNEDHVLVLEIDTERLPEDIEIKEGQDHAPGFFPPDVVVKTINQDVSLNAITSVKYFKYN